MAELATPALVGRVIGNWELLRLLGEGSFGAVYEAANLTIAGRRAAVKVLHRRMALDAEMKRRFVNEAAAASRADHENIVQIFDGGITDDGTCYAVMELLRGCSLGRLLEGGRLELGRAVNVGLQVASALASAHSLGIVHRDLKPDNIFIVARPTNPEFVKLLDFGVAKLRGEAREASGGAGGYPWISGRGETRDGMLVGTPGYMSPEQWRSVPDVDGRADVYALGMILYQCLAGELPYSGGTPYEWLTAHLDAPVPELSSVAPGVPAVMCHLVRQMLAKDRDDRPASMMDVIYALHALRRASTSGPTATTLAVPRAALLAGSRATMLEPAAASVVEPKRTPRLAWLLLALGFLTAAAALVASLRLPPGPAPVVVLAPPPTLPEAVTPSPWPPRLTLDLGALRFETPVCAPAPRPRPRRSPAPPAPAPKPDED